MKQLKMEAKKIRLFGVDIVVPSIDDDDHPVYNDPMPSFTPSITPEIASSSGGESIQESDQKGAEGSATDHVGLSTRLCNGSPSVSRINDEKKGKSLALTMKKVDEIYATDGNDLSVVGNAAISKITDDKKGKSPAFTMYTSTFSVVTLDDHRVYNPMPLRCSPMVIPETGYPFGEKIQFFSQRSNFGQSYQRLDQISATDHVDACPAVSRVITEERKGKSLKRKQSNVVADENKGKPPKRRRNNVVDDEKSEPLPSPEELPQIVLQKVERLNGTKPIFLYQKSLEQSDVKPDQNRLFMTKSEKVMEFLTEEEKTRVNDSDSKEGLKIFAVDPQGKCYMLNLGKWESLGMIVLNSDWKKMILDNYVKKGDWVQLWGYRINKELRFAVNFLKPEAEANVGSSSSSNEGTSTAN